MPRLLVCGAVNWDVTLFVTSLPKPGEEVRVNRVISVPGGKGANTAVAAARILGAGAVGVIGSVGSDDIASRQVAILQDEGVDTSCIATSADLASGQAYVLVDQAGEDMILTHRAANRALTREFVVERVAESVATSETVVIIDPPLEAALELAQQAASMKKKVVLAPATLVRHGYAALERLVRAADYLILNEHEALALEPAQSALASAERLSKMLAGKAVIVTLGSQGSALCHGGDSERVPTLPLSQFGLSVVSTVGAGDTFEGAFAAFKLMGMPDLQACFLANVAAALKTTREQTRGSPALEEILKFAQSEAMRPTYDRFRPA